MSDKDFDLSVSQTARRLGYTIGWVYSLVYTNKIVASKVSGRWRIPMSAVQEIERRRQIQTAKPVVTELVKPVST